MAAWRECSAPPHAAGALAPYTCKFVRTLPEVTVKLRHALLSLAIAACVSTPAASAPNNTGSSGRTSNVQPWLRNTTV